MGIIMIQGVLHTIQYLNKTVFGCFIVIVLLKNLSTQTSDNLEQHHRPEKKVVHDIQAKINIRFYQ